MSVRTPLYEWHAGHNGRMVDFAGWSMPVQYSTIVEEHEAVRTGAGLFDISHMGRLSFSGADSLALIQRVYTNNAATMKENQVRYGLICNEQGGIRDDVLVYRWSYGYSMVVNASNRQKIVDWLQVHQAGLDVQVQDQTMETCMVAVQGPKAMEITAGLTEADARTLGYYFAVATRYRGHNCVVSRTGYTGEDGMEVMIGAAHATELWNDLLARGARPCGLGARDTLRLEAAMPLYGHELTETIDPLQAGLQWAVKLEKGDFIGREAIVRQKDQRRRVRIGLELDGKRIAREEARVFAGGNEIGTVTSGTFGPTVGKAIAMAYVEPEHAAASTACAVDIRGKPAPARVVALPFYRRPKA
jgi:aminomethyltransferase